MLSVPSSKMSSHVSKTPKLRKACSNHILRAEMPSEWNRPNHPPSWILLLVSSQIPPFLEMATKQYNRHRYQHARMIPLQRPWKRFAEG